MTHASLKIFMLLNWKISSFFSISSEEIFKNEHIFKENLTERNDDETMKLLISFIYYFRSLKVSLESPEVFRHTFHSEK